MADRSYMNLYLPDDQLEAAQSALAGHGCAPGPFPDLDDADRKGQRFQWGFEEITGGGYDLFDALAAASVTFYGYGATHYAYDGYAYAGKGGKLTQVLTTVDGELVVPTIGGTVRAESLREVAEFQAIKTEVDACAKLEKAG